MIDARAFTFAVGDYLVADGEGGGLAVAHDADGLLAVTARIPAGQGIRLLFSPDEATTVGCHICTMAHYLRMAA